MTRLFGTDGIRGLANHYPMSPDMALKLGQVIGMYFRRTHKKPRILIGKDTRRSGYMLEQALCSGILSSGVDVGFLGPLPTPGIAYLTRGMRACAGIVISASHNAFQDNGIKIFSADGFKLPDDVENELEGMLKKESLFEDPPTGALLGRAKRIDDAIGQYAVFLKEQFPKKLTLDGVRIVMDTANGAAYRVAPKVFEELGAELILRGAEPNGLNINDACGALHPKKLRDEVYLYKADLGLAFDGDADRLIVVDEKANEVDGDKILAICANYLKQNNKLAKNTLVATVMSNMGLEISMNRAGINLVRTKVGDRYVVEQMRANGYNLGGEQSGHLVFSDYQTTGDGILAGLMLMQIVRETGKTVSELSQCMEKLPQVLKNVKVKKKVPVVELPKLASHIKECEKTLGKKGRVLFRYSGTENLARIMIEGENSQQIEHMANDLAASTQSALQGFEGQA